MRLIATFQFGWLPFFLSFFGWCHTSFDPAWVPHYLGLGAIVFIRPECHVTLAWVPSYSFGLGAVVFYPAWVPHYLGLVANFFIRPGCRCIYPAWVPHCLGLSAT
jgi:hypothetical protein